MATKVSKPKKVSADQKEADAKASSLAPIKGPSEAKAVAMSKGKQVRKRDGSGPGCGKKK